MTSLLTVTTTPEMFEDSRNFDQSQNPLNVKKSLKTQVTLRKLNGNQKRSQSLCLVGRNIFKDPNLSTHERSVNVMVNDSFPG